MQFAGREIRLLHRRQCIALAHDAHELRRRGWKDANIHLPHKQRGERPKCGGVRPSLPQKLRQLGDVSSNSPRLVARHQSRRRSEGRRRITLLSRGLTAFRSQTKLRLGGAVRFLGPRRAGGGGDAYPGCWLACAACCVWPVCACVDHRYHACLTACGTSCKCNAGDAREKPHRTTKQASVSSTVQGSGKQRGRPIAWSTAPHGGPLAGALAP